VRNSSEVLTNTDTFLFLEGVYGYSFLDDDVGPVVMHTGCERFLTVTRCDFSESLNVRYSSVYWNYVL
jgi:hypothetical protein